MTNIALEKLTGLLPYIKNQFGVDCVVQARKDYRSNRSYIQYRISKYHFEITYKVADQAYSVYDFKRKTRYNYIVHPMDVIKTILKFRVINVKKSDPSTRPDFLGNEIINFNISLVMPMTYSQIVETIKRETLEAIIKSSGGSLRVAAEKIGMSRENLSRWVRKTKYLNSQRIAPINKEHPDIEPECSEIERSDSLEDW